MAQPLINTMFGNEHLSGLPPEVLHNIFLYIPSQEVLWNIAPVCKTWHGIVHQTRFWFQRLGDLGFSLCKYIQKELISYDDNEELLLCLQATCYHIETSQKHNAALVFGSTPRISEGCVRYTRCEAQVCQGRMNCNQETCVVDECRGRGPCISPPSSHGQHHHHVHRYRKISPRPIVKANSLKDIARDMEDDGIWRINDEKIRVAAIMLCFRKPELFELELYSNPSNLKKVHFLLAQLVRVSCQVHIKDYFSWRSPRKSSTDELLTRLTRPNTRCTVTLFRGSLENLDNLPTTINNLSLGIGSDTQAASCGQGFIDIKRRFPYLDELRVHIVPGVDVQHLPPLPNGRCQSSLFLSGVGSPELWWAVNTARKLRPHGQDSQYRYLVFPSSKLIYKTTQTLLEYLQQDTQVNFWELVVSSPFITGHKEGKLSILTRRFWPDSRGFSWIKLDDFLALSHYRW